VKLVLDYNQANKSGPIPIVNEKWVLDSVLQGTLLDDLTYRWDDTHGSFSPTTLAADQSSPPKRTLKRPRGSSEKVSIHGLKADFRMILTKMMAPIRRRHLDLSTSQTGDRLVVFPSLFKLMLRIAASSGTQDCASSHERSNSGRSRLFYRRYIQMRLSDDSFCSCLYRSVRCGIRCHPKPDSHCSKRTISVFPTHAALQSNKFYYIQVLSPVVFIDH
jgi:hypothetical protein